MARTLIGVVASDKTDKTIVVRVDTRKTHPVYKKQYTVSKKFMAHDEQNEAHIGDKVEIGETRPLSARKRHTLKRVIERAAIQHVETMDEMVAEVAGQKPKEEEAQAAEEATS